MSHPSDISRRRAPPTDVFPDDAQPPRAPTWPVEPLGAEPMESSAGSRARGLAAEPESFNPTARRVRCLRGDPPSPDRIICLPPVPRRRPRRPPRGCHPTSRGRLAGAPRRGHRGARRGDASIASHLLIPGASSISAQPTGASAPHIPPPRRPRHPRIRRHVVTRGDVLRVVTQLSLERGRLRECGALLATYRAQLATHAPLSRPRRHPRRPAPRRDLPRRRYDRGLANRAAAMTARGGPPRKPRRRR